jgi:hypothetical protein
MIADLTFTPHMDSRNYRWGEPGTALEYNHEILRFMEKSIDVCFEY